MSAKKSKVLKAAHAAIKAAEVLLEADKDSGGAGLDGFPPVQSAPRPAPIVFFVPKGADEFTIEQAQALAVAEAHRKQLLARHNHIADTLNAAAPLAAKATKAAAVRAKATEVAAAANRGAIKSPIKRLIVDTVRDVADGLPPQEIWPLLIAELPPEYYSEYGIEIIGWPDFAHDCTKREARRGLYLRYAHDGEPKCVSLETLWDYMTVALR